MAMALKGFKMQGKIYEHDMKIGEKLHSVAGSDSEFVVETKFSNDPYLERAKQLRDAGVGQSGEHRLVGSIPMHLYSQWLKEAGVSHDDRQAAKDVLRRKLLSGEFDKFRVWEGKY